MNGWAPGIVSVVAGLLLIGYSRQPKCHCPYRRRLFLPVPKHGLHDRTSSMVMLEVVWLLLVLNNFLLLQRDVEAPWWLRLLTGLLVAFCLFYAMLLPLRIYWHAYPSVRRLRRRLVR